MKKARETAGLTQDEMAAELRAQLAHLEKFSCKDADTVSAWETEARRPKLLIVTLRAWALICDVDFSWLATGVDTSGDDDRLVTHCDKPKLGLVPNPRPRLPMNLTESTMKGDLTEAI